MAQILEFGACQQKRDEAEDAAHVTREANKSDYLGLSWEEYQGRFWSELSRQLRLQSFEHAFADHAERTATMEGV